MTAFISGPLAPPDGYFEQHYVPRILEAISADISFVMGPAPGIDTLALQFLRSHIPCDRITVFLTEFENKAYRPDLAWFEEAGGVIQVAGGTTTERDEAMTKDSDYDILRYMTEEESKVAYGADWYPKVTATEKNERRRKRMAAQVMGLEDDLKEEPEESNLLRERVFEPAKIDVHQKRKSVFWKLKSVLMKR